MILDIKGPRQESVLKQKSVSWLLCLIVRSDCHDAVCPMH
jgi:hypothetical protein